MVVVSETVHPRGLDFQNQRKLVILRDVHGLEFKDIALKIRNLEGHCPSTRACCDYYHKFHAPAGRRKSQYHKCGRKPWKLSPDVKKFLLRTLKQQRKQSVCTCATLQLATAREMGVAIEQSTIRKFIMSQGFRWLPRAQKKKFSKEVMALRLTHAQGVVKLGHAGLRQKMSFSTDGWIQ